MPLGVVAIVLGVIAFRTGWMLPPSRRGVRQPRLYGVGAAVAGVGLLYLGVTYFVLSDDRPDALSSNPWAALAGNGLELFGIALIAASHLRPRRGRSTHPGA
ncbi:hypothetical protein [Streptomyces globisporus]|uniref:hypothetical protein n=1 Tax=Streptomyces globisporus TaxID=1908 RepID=UPI00131D1A99|nr:hypothetical protein [Streptomyces globisporus]